MKQRSLHIAAGLAGIFLFPLLFQPWHIFHDHGHAETEHHCCETHHHHKTAPDHLAEFVIQTEQHHKAEQPSASGELLAEYSEPCPICEYEFPVKFTPSQHFMAFSTSRIEPVLAMRIENDAYAFHHPQIVPRAPPSAA